jgi:hypothetical protein
MTWQVRSDSNLNILFHVQPGAAIFTEYGIVAMFFATAFGARLG